jgi:hypothetical protein
VPGVLLIPSARSIGAAIDGMFFVWLEWTPEDLRNLVRWLPVSLMKPTPPAVAHTPRFMPK